MSYKGERKSLYNGKSMRLSSNQIKEIEEKPVFTIWYIDENGDEITSHWGTKKQAEFERKKLKENGYGVSDVFRK